MGECAHWPRERFVAADAVLDALPGLEPIRGDGVTQLFRMPGWQGDVGLIRPLSHRFCSECNRIRITADGKLKPCLHSSTEIPLRGLEGPELVEAIRRGIYGKPAQHHMDQAHASESLRAMNEIGG